jgi:hypothetical protein
MELIQAWRNTSSDAILTDEQSTASWRIPIKKEEEEERKATKKKIFLHQYY